MVKNKIVTVKLKDEKVVIENVKFYSFERNFVMVQHKKGKDYFKIATVLGIEEREIEEPNLLTDPK